MTKIVVFSGGRGTSYIQEALAGVECDLVFLINGYDSGLSTGRIRWAFTGMLGPSDFRKCIATALGHGKTQTRHLGRLFEDRTVLSRYPNVLKRPSIESILELLASEEPDLPITTATDLTSWLQEFLTTDVVHSGELPVDDLPLGNAILTGAFLAHGDFNSAIDAVQVSVLRDLPTRALNVTQGEDLWLAATTRKHLTVDEGTIVGQTPDGPIEELFLLDRHTASVLWHPYRTWQIADKTALDIVAARATVPVISSKAKQALEQADLIVYGSGTQHSSLLPSYLTSGVTEAVLSNENAQKLLLGNGERDLDFAQLEQPIDLVTKSLNLLTSKGAHQAKDLVNSIYLATSRWSTDKAPSSSIVESIDSIPVTCLGREQINASDAYQQFSALLTQTLGHMIAPSSTTVSLVIPVLNEVQTIHRLISMLEQLHQLDGLQIERIVVDGGSIDGTWEAICESPWLTAYQADGRNGRFECIYTGLRHARGDYICVMHADFEYEIADAEQMIRVLKGYPKSLIIGSRTHGAQSESNLRRAYKGRRTDYWLSRFGGVVVAAGVSVRMGRVISDPFFGPFAAKRQTLNSITPVSGDLDANVAMLLKAHDTGVGVVELGVSYQPRRRSTGKKTTVTHGLKALLRVFVPRGAGRKQAMSQTEDV